MSVLIREQRHGESESNPTPYKHTLVPFSALTTFTALALLRISWKQPSYGFILIHDRYR